MDGRPVTGISFFAVPDPGDAARVTCWRRNHRAALVAWPAEASYGPTLLERDLPPGLDPEGRRDHLIGWFACHVAPWRAAVEYAVTTDPFGCGVQFANYTGRCCACPRRLQSHGDRVTGACAGCRARLASDDLAGLVAAMGRKPRTEQPTRVTQ
jgi:hypothetical protein